MQPENLKALLRTDAPNRHAVAGQKLKEAKVQKPDGVPWRTFVRKTFNLSHQRADVLMRIADGIITVEDDRAHSREVKRRTRAARKQALVENNCDSAVGEDDGDSEQTIWRRGLMFRSQEAITGGAFEDWSRFKSDRQLVDVVKRAAETWMQLATYVEGLCK